MSGFRPIGLITGLGLICLCAWWTIGFEGSCVSDGCIGVFFILPVPSVVPALGTHLYVFRRSL